MAKILSSKVNIRISSIGDPRLPPDWRASMVDDSFNVLPGTNYSNWAKTGIPNVTPFYRGTDPRNAVVDAYGDPAFDPDTGCFYLWGGGHGDGTYNGVIKFDPRTKTYSVIGEPTPPSVYLPEYINTTSPIYYPSGKYFSGFINDTPTEDPKLPPIGLGGLFLTEAEGLVRAVDGPYIAPALAKLTAHAYASLVVRKGIIYFFCAGGYAEFNIMNGKWGRYGVDLGMQLKSFQSNMTNFPFSQGNAAVYDEVTDRIIVTLQPGDFPMGARNGVFVFDPNTRQIESVHNQSAVYLGPSPSMVKADRKVFLFYKIGNYLQPQNLNNGMIFNIDSKTFSYFKINGNPSGTIYSQVNLQETIPAWYDGKQIHRWNYEPGQNNLIHSVNPNPIGGDGSPGNPFVFTQTSRTVSNAPSEVQYRYRGNWWPAANAMLILPKSNQDWRVLCLK